MFSTIICPYKAISSVKEIFEIESVCNPPSDSSKVTCVHHFVILNVRVSTLEMKTRLVVEFVGKQTARCYPGFPHLDAWSTAEPVNIGTKNHELHYISSFFLFKSAIYVLSIELAPLAAFGRSRDARYNTVNIIL